MARKTQQTRTLRKPARRIADARKVRFGSGNVSPALSKSRDPLTHDTQAVRFGSGNIAPSLQK